MLSVEIITPEKQRIKNTWKINNEIEKKNGNNNNHNWTHQQRQKTYLKASTCVDDHLFTSIRSFVHLIRSRLYVELGGFSVSYC